MTPDPRVVVITRVGCHLCDEALAIAEQVCAGLGVPWAAKDVDSDPALLDLYSDHVPVTTVDGRLLSYWFLTAADLAAALSTEPSPTSRPQG